MHALLCIALHYVELERGYDAPIPSFFDIGPALSFPLSSIALTTCTDAKRGCGSRVQIALAWRDVQACHGKLGWCGCVSIDNKLDMHPGRGHSLIEAP